MQKTETIERGKGRYAALEKAPRWLFEPGQETIRKLLELRRHRPGRGALDRTTRAIGRAMGRSGRTLERDLIRIRHAAAGTGRVDCESDRKTAALFMSLWNELGPSRNEINAELRARRTKRTTRTPAQGAAALERLTRTAREFRRVEQARGAA